MLQTHADLARPLCCSSALVSVDGRVPGATYGFRRAERCGRSLSLCRGEPLARLGRRRGRRPALRRSVPFCRSEGVDGSESRDRSDVVGSRGDAVVMVDGSEVTSGGSEAGALTISTGVGDVQCTCSKRSLERIQVNPQSNQLHNQTTRRLSASPSSPRPFIRIQS
jgi:hypothetical protein